MNTPNISPQGGRRQGVTPPQPHYYQCAGCEQPHGITVSRETYNTIVPYDGSDRAGWYRCPKCGSTWHHLLIVQLGDEPRTNEEPAEGLYTVDDLMTHAQGEEYTKEQQDAMWLEHHQNQEPAEDERGES